MPNAQILESPMRERTESLFSRYDLEDLSDDDEDDVFLTPTEGLSEIGEGDEEETAMRAGLPVNTVPAKQTLASHAKVNDPKTHTLEKSTEKDILGTGPSTLRRSTAAITEVSVKARHIDKAGLFAIDQSAVLGQDVDTTRELLVLFLRSQMREAEEVCLEKDPDCNHLYLQVAYCIFQAIKVRSFVLFQTGRPETDTF